MRTITIEDLQNYKDELGDNEFETSYFYNREHRLHLTNEISQKINDGSVAKEVRERPIMMNSDAAKQILYKGASMAGGLSHFFLRSVALLAKKL